MQRPVGKELRTISNMTMRYVEKYTNKKRVDAITGTNGWIIGFVAAREGEGKAVYQRDLEKEFGITRSTASKVVNLMVQKGLIEKRSVPEDARLKRLTLTERAQDIRRMMLEDHARIERVMTAGFSPEELQTLRGYLARIKENLSQCDAMGGQEQV